jgi:Fe-S oxidoreductase
MDYYPPVIGIIKDNIVAKGNPLGLGPKTFTGWAEGLDLPRGGKTVLYTGLEYQMMPYSYGLLDMVKRSGPFSEKLGLAGKAKGVFDKLGIDVTKLITVARHPEVFNGLLRRFAVTFRKLGVEFGYLYEGEIYSGGLLYEFGFHDLLAEYGQRLKLTFAGVEQAIVLSPHSLEMFRKVFPQLGITFDTRFRHYSEVLLDSFKAGAVSSRTVSIHDPCHLARSLDISEEPRQVLSRVRGLELKEVTHTNRRFTTCCGAPCEVYLPVITELVAGHRLDEFAKEGLSTVLTLCPFCYFNLAKEAVESKRDVRVVDYIELVNESLGG